MKPHIVVKLATVLYLTLLIALVAAVYFRSPEATGTWVLLVAVAIYLAMTIGVSIYAVAAYRFRAVDGFYATTWEQLPPGLQQQSSDGYPPLEAAGFTLQAYAQQHSKVPGVAGAMLLMTDDSRTVMLGWIIVDSANAKAQQIALMSRATTGERICTAVAGTMLPVMMRDGNIMVPQITDVPTLLSLHRARLTHHLGRRSLEVLPQGETDTIAWITAEDAEDMQYKSSLGFYKLVDKGEWYRPTMWFALPTAFAALPPWNWLPKQWQKWQAAVEMRKVGWQKPAVPEPPPLRAR